MKKSMLILLIPFLILFIVSCEGEGEDVDETPPVVSILSPTANSTVSGTINIQVSASDNNVLEKVELYTSNGLIGTSTTNDPVHSFDWDTDAAGDNGEYIFYAIAYDDAGNSAISITITLNVMNYRTITFTSQCYEEMEFTFWEEVGVIPALGSVSVDVPKNNGTTNFAGIIYSCGENPIWSLDVEVEDQDDSWTLWTYNNLFYLKLTNLMSVDITYTTVNQSLGTFYEETCYGDLPNNGIKYGLGYFYSLSNSNVYAYLYNHPVYSYVYWDPVSLPMTNNQLLELTASGALANFGNEEIPLTAIIDNENGTRSMGILQGYSEGTLQVPELPKDLELSDDQ